MVEVEVIMFVIDGVVLGLERFFRIWMFVVIFEF